MAYRLHRGYSVTVPEDRDEKFWIARELVDTYGWTVSRASAALGFRTSELAVSA